MDGCPAHCRMFFSIPDLYLLDTISNMFYCQMSPGGEGKITPRWELTPHGPPLFKGMYDLQPRAREQACDQWKFFAVDQLIKSISSTFRLKFVSVVLYTFLRLFLTFFPGYVKNLRIFRAKNFKPVDHKFNMNLELETSDISSIP